jgi:acetoin utilization protein AcuB
LNPVTDFTHYHGFEKKRREQMLAGERMTRRPIAVGQNEPINEALSLMRQEKVRRLPVLDKRGKLVGIVCEKDLLYASPSPVTSLSMHELHYLLSKITVKDVMTKDVITVKEDTPLEEVARVMADNKIGCAPVMRQGELVGIITETDIFKILLEMMGAREHGVRLTLSLPHRVGTLAEVSREIANRNGNIVALGTFRGEDTAHSIITLKVQDLSQEELLGALEGLEAQVRDVQET